MKFRTLLILTLGCLGCTSRQLVNEQPGRIILDNSLRGEELPEWTRSTKTSWEENGELVSRTSYTVRGNQKVNGCFDLAKLESKEQLLSQLKEEVSGEINLASEGVSEDFDPLITKSLRTSMAGKIQGLRIKEQAFERYMVNSIERIDCFVLSSMKSSDYSNLKSSILQNLVFVDDKVKQAVRERQKKFFKNDLSSSEPNDSVDSGASTRSEVSKVED